MTTTIETKLSSTVTTTVETATFIGDNNNGGSYNALYCSDQHREGDVRDGSRDDGRDKPYKSKYYRKTDSSIDKNNNVGNDKVDSRSDLHEVNSLRDTNRNIYNNDITSNNDLREEYNNTEDEFDVQSYKVKQNID